MALSSISFIWEQGKRVLHNWSIPVLGWNATSNKLYPVQVDGNGNLQTVSGPGTPAFINVTATTTPAALPAKQGTQVAIKNMSGGNMTIGRASGGTWTLPDGTERTFVIQSSSSELLVSVASGTYNVDAEVWG